MDAFAQLFTLYDAEHDTEVYAALCKQRSVSDMSVRITEATSKV